MRKKKKRNHKNGIKYNYKLKYLQIRWKIVNKKRKIFGFEENMQVQSHNIN